MSKFKIGDIVVNTKSVNLDGDFPALTVRDLTVSGKVITDHEWKSSGTSEWYEEDLILETEAVEKLDALQKEFNKLEPLIQEKMKDLTDSFHDMNSIIEKSGFRLSDFRGARSLVRNMMDAGGWSGSSFSC